MAVDDPSPPRLHELSGHRRLVQVGRATASSVAIVVVLIAAFYLVVPDDRADPNIPVRLALSLITLAGTVAAAAWHVTTTRFPVLALLPALAAVGVVSLVGFATTYLLLSTDDPSAFTEPLNHTGALYYSMTTATTIGYGDVAPRTDAARIVAMVHMVTNVVVVGAGIRALVHAARRRSTAA